MKLLELEIKNIRGIKELVLHPNENNFAVWGTNGSGKSGVVDALDFLLAGKISRLTGEGTGNITLKKHGAHIDCDDLSTAFVRAKIKIKELQDPVIIQRIIDRPNELISAPEVKPYITPIEEIAKREQHVLTRREILSFITADGKTRAKKIQDLMNLDEIEAIRSSLVKVKNNYKNKVKDDQQALRRTETEVAARVGLTKYKAEDVLKIVNTNRQTLGGESISLMTSDNLITKITPLAKIAEKNPLNITILDQEFSNIVTVLSEKFQMDIRENDATLRGWVASIHEDKNLLRTFSNQNLIKMGIQALDESGSCPLCDTNWKVGELKNYLEEKLASTKLMTAKVGEIDKIKQALLTQVDFVLSSLNKAILMIQSASQIEGELFSLINWKNELTTLRELLEEPLIKYHNPNYDFDLVARLIAPEGLQSLITKIKDETSRQFPQSTPEETAWVRLTKLSLELKHLEEKQRTYENSQLSFKRAEILLAEFERARDEILGKLYDEIKDRFVELYRELHQDDESDFKADLHPSGAGLDFEVDFYKRGSHPPHALHSEGHQDSMGVCLFLALSEKLTAGLIDLIILDDVVMSVDSNHRRELCNVLRKHFKGKQFLITTHDKTWANQLCKHQLVSSKQLIEFYNWKIETGPRVSERLDLWERINEELDKEDIPNAAFHLRRASEQFFAEICDSWKVPVPYSLDGRNELGEFLFGAMGEFTSLIKKAKDVAKSWSSKETKDEIQILDNVRAEIFRNLGEEQWAVNVNIHYNDWATFTKEDFMPVVASFKNLFALFICPNPACGGLLFVQRDGKTPLNVRCDCNQTNWNLVKKSN